MSDSSILQLAQLDSSGLADRAFDFVQTSPDEAHFEV
jgi:hypothetical protein